MSNFATNFDLESMSDEELIIEPLNYSGATSSPARSHSNDGDLHVFLKESAIEMKKQRDAALKEVFIHTRAYMSGLTIYNLANCKSYHIYRINVY